MDGSGKGTKTIDLAPCPNLDLGLGQDLWPTRSLCNRHQSAGQSAKEKASRLRCPEPTAQMSKSLLPPSQWGPEHGGPLPLPLGSCPVPGWISSALDGQSGFSPTLCLAVLEELVGSPPLCPVLRLSFHT